MLVRRGHPARKEARLALPDMHIDSSAWQPYGSPSDTRRNDLLLSVVRARLARQRGCQCPSCSAPVLNPVVGASTRVLYVPTGLNQKLMLLIPAGKYNNLDPRGS